MGVCKKIKRRADQERNVWELFRMFKNEKKILGLSESTLQNYEDSLKRFMDYMECTDAPIQEIDYDDVLSFTQGLQEEELSVSSINHYLRDIRAFFNWCSKSGYCRKIEVKLVKGQETVKETYSEEELKRIGEIEKIAVIVSDEKRKDMDAALKEKFPGYNEEINDQVYTSLIQNQVLPEECEILISTSRLKEGVDILNENACVICDNHILSNLIQFFGRVRVGGGTVYIIEDAQQHEIKHDKLLYEYAKQQEITAANKFVDTYIKEQEDVFEYGPTFSLIRCREA